MSWSRLGIGFGRVISFCLGQVLVFALVFVKSWSSVGLRLCLGQVLVKSWSLSLPWSSFLPFQLSISLTICPCSCPCLPAFPLLSFFLFLAPLINAKKWQKSKALPQREVHPPNGVGKVCKPSVLPSPMYKLPLAPSQLPTFHRAFKQILILPSRVNWRERSVYEGLQDCSRCKNPFSHQTVNKLGVHLFCTSSHYLRKVNLDSWCWSLFLLH